MARILGYTDQECLKLAEAATLHDVGKVGIPTAVLRKPGPLTEAEWTIMKGHSRIGASLIKTPLARDIALTHHERWNGGGYPTGLCGEQIPVAARMVAIADQYDALRSPRTYKRAYNHEETVTILTRGDDRTHPDHFDPQLLCLFKMFHSEFDRIYTLDHAFVR